MKKRLHYWVYDRKGADIWFDKYDNKENAIIDAKYKWGRLSEHEKSISHIIAFSALANKVDKSIPDYEYTKDIYWNSRDLE